MSLCLSLGYLSKLPNVFDQIEDSQLFDVVHNVLPLLQEVPLRLSLGQEGAEKFYQAAFVPHLINSFKWIL